MHEITHNNILVMGTDGTACLWRYKRAHGHTADLWLPVCAHGWMNDHDVCFTRDHLLYRVFYHDWGRVTIYECLCACRSCSVLQRTSRPVSSSHCSREKNRSLRVSPALVFGPSWAFSDDAMRSTVLSPMKDCTC